MILKSEAECITELGNAGKHAWGEGILRLSFLGVDYEIHRTKPKLEPLSDEEVFDAYHRHHGGTIGCLRAVIQAHDARNAEILASETEEELVTALMLLDEEHAEIGEQELFIKEAIAKVRAHDRAKAVAACAIVTSPRDS